MKKRRLTEKNILEKGRNIKYSVTTKRKNTKQEKDEWIKLIKTKEETWKYINKYRKKKERIDENIDLEFGIRKKIGICIS